MNFAAVVRDRRLGVYGLFFFAALITLSVCSGAVCQEAPTTAASSPAVASSQIKTAAPAIETPKNISKIKVSFDEKSPGVVYIESNGERIRVDTTAKTVEPLTAAAADEKQEVTAPAAAPAPTPADAKKKAAEFDFKRGQEPYDYRVVNIPTPKNVPKGTWNLAFTHRFTQPVAPLKDSAKNLFGLDSFGVASFGINYGVTDKLYLSAYRSPLCEKGLCRDIEVGIGYNWISHDKNSPSCSRLTRASKETIILPRSIPTISRR